MVAQEEQRTGDGSSGRTQQLVLYLAVFLVSLGYSVAVPVLPDLQAAFDISAAQVVLTTSIWGAARLVMDLPLGFIVERLHTGRVMIAGTVLSAVGAFIAAAAPSFAVMLAGRAVSGVGAAVVSYVAIITLLDLSEPNRRGRSLGIYQAVLQAGSSLSPVAAGFASVIGGWPAAFAIAGVGCVASAVTLIASGAVRHQSASRRKKADEPVADAREEAIVEARVREVRPVLLSIDYATFALLFVTGGLVLTGLPLYGSDRLGMDAAGIGLVLGIATGLRFFIGLAGAELSDRVGRRVVLLSGMVLMIVPLLLFSLVDNVLWFVVATWVLAAGRFGNSMPIAMLSDYAPPSRLGRLVAVNRFVADLGIVVGPLVVGVLIDAWGFGPPFLAAAALISTAALSLWLTSGRISAHHVPDRLRQSSESA
ncbi:MAG TPA: MFS transporter [Candidatus Limnocylindria bacterium]|nr:MFS transporter [Candidatus Limnocylindria bacterium]